MSKLKNIVACILTGSMIFSYAVPAFANDQGMAPKNFQVTVSSENQQEIKGWGVTPSVNPYQDGYRQGIDSQVFSDLGCTIFRYELHPANAFGDGSLIGSNVKYQADVIERMVASGVEQYMFSTWTPPKDMNKNGDKMNEVYGQYYVNVLDYITKKRGLPPPVAISIQNEPAATGVQWSSHTYNGEQYVDTFVAVSKALDAAGYGDIVMIGAEAAGYGAQFMQLGSDFVNFEKYPEFLEHFDAWCTHSYRDGAPNGVIRQTVQDSTDKYLEDIARYPQIKDHWQTEYCGTLPCEDQVLAFMQMFCTDMGLLKFNYWFWWIAFNFNDRIYDGEQNPDYQHLYLESRGDKKGLINRIGQAVSTIYKNVPVGSYSRRVDTDDPNAFVYGQACMDSCAFSTKNGTVLIYVNQNYEDKTYDFNNLDGKTAKIYQFQSPDVRMQTVWEGEIKNGKIKNITLPARSTNIIVCSNVDDCAPEISFKTDYSVVVDNNVYISDKQKKNLVFQMDEPALVTVNDKKVNVTADNTFIVEASAATSAEYKIKATDRYGNERLQYITYNYIDNYINNQIDPPPMYYGKETYNITGTINKPVEITINDGKAIKVEAGKYSIPIELHHGENKIKLVAKDEKNNIVTDEFVLNNDILEPTINILSEKELTTSDNEYILRFKTDKELTDVRINNKSVSSWAMDYRFCYNDDKTYDYVMPLKEGENKFDIWITDKYGNTAEDSVIVNYVKDDSVAVESTGEIYVKKNKDVMSIDGEFNEKGWILNNKVMNRYQERERSIINFGLMYDDEALYIGAKVKDNMYLNNGVQNWYCDCLELYIDPGYERNGIYDDNDMQLFFGYDKEGKKMSNGDKDMEYVFKVADDGSYTVEIKIPWSTIGGKAEIGRKIGFDVQVDDPVSVWDATGMRAEPVYRSISLWNGDMNNWADSSKFGTIILSE